jgi:hypothetical protein
MSTHSHLGDEIRKSSLVELLREKLIFLSVMYVDGVTATQ